MKSKVMTRYNSNSSSPSSPSSEDSSAPARPAQTKEEAPLPPEFGGRKDGLDPTRYGDWEKDGRCIDF